MEIRVKRRFLGDKYTIGSLFVNGERYVVKGKVVDTMEDKNRDLNMNGRFDNVETPVHVQVAVPPTRWVACWWDLTQSRAG